MRNSQKIENETVYVIYYKGKPFESSGRKIVYMNRASAKSVITSESKRLAQEIYRQSYNQTFYDIGKEERTKWIEICKKDFEIIEYTPKGETANG